MAALKEPVKIFIVQSLACFETPLQVVEAVKQDFNIETVSYTHLDVYKRQAYFCFNNGYGFVQPGNYYIFDNVGKKPIEQNGILFPGDVKKGKAIQQLSFQDYLDK